MPCPNYNHIRAAFAANHALSTNQHDRVYQNRKTLPLEKKVSIAIEFLKVQEAVAEHLLQKCEKDQGQAGTKGGVARVGRGLIDVQFGL